MPRVAGGGAGDAIPPLLRDAMALHASGRVVEAAALYARVLKRSPRDGNALNLAGVAARQLGDLPRALEHGRRAVMGAPTSAIFRANYGATLASAGRLPEAVAEFRAALAGRPDDAVTWRNMGQAMAALGDASGAVPVLERAVAIAPSAPEAWLALAHARREAGDAPGAREAARRAVAPPVAEQAAFLLAALGEGDAPGRAPADYVRSLFDQFAPRFDGELTALGYATPAALAALIEASGVSPARALDVLDLGCGTGLSGVPLAPFARRLVGVDLSPRMLAEAGKRGLYDALEEADLLEWLPAHPAAFDLVVAADVLNYLGDLGPAVAGIAGALRPGGRAAFSVETGDVVPFALGEGMRYRHAPAHVATLLDAAGFRVEVARAVVLRQEKGVPVAGTLFLTQRR
ncbi:MAG: hypothetical protein JWO24_3905 [Rhodospirillales bacterium]|jgi:predicted TPR repeat methyltransferase|nr:hypothetical protein [Rhodospirillales bacterium]